MRSLVALLIAISTVYFGFSQVTITFSGFNKKSKTLTGIDALPESGSLFSRRQSGNGMNMPKTRYSTTQLSHLFSAPVNIEGLLGQSTSAAVISANTPELQRSYTVENLVGICAFNCND